MPSAPMTRSCCATIMFLNAMVPVLWSMASHAWFTFRVAGVPWPGPVAESISIACMLTRWNML